jgi:hypothetical protein
VALTAPAGAINFDLVDHAELVNYARLYYNEVLAPQFLLRRYLPERNHDELEWAANQGGLQDVDAALYRSWDVPAPMTGRPGIARIRGEIAPISRGIPLSEEEKLRLRSIERGNNDPRIRQIYADLERMLRSVALRVELARADVLIDGKFTLAENGLFMEADFGMPTANKVTLSTAWTVANAASAQPITDLLAIADVLSDVGADISDYDLVLSRKKLPALQVNQQLLAFAQGGDASAPQRLNQNGIQAIFTDEGLPDIVLMDEMVRIEGVQTRVLPTTQALLLPKPGTGDPYGETLFGPTAEAVLMVERGVLKANEAPGIYGIVLENQHPVQTVTIAGCTAVPTLINPELLVSIVVG